MRKHNIIVALIVFMITLSSTMAQMRHVKLDEVKESDQFLYFYFDLFLQEFGYSLKYMANDNNYYLKLSNITYKRIQLTRDEAIYYESRGIETKARYVVEPFYQFSKRLVFLGETNHELVRIIKILENTTNEELFREASLKIIAMNRTIREMYVYLDEIDELKLKNGTHILKFDTKFVRKWLNEMENKINDYSNTLSNLIKERKIEPITKRSLWIDVSTRNPILYDRAMIYGYTSTPGVLWIHIEHMENKNKIIEKMYQIKTSKDGSFFMQYSFNELTEYKVYATQEVNGTQKTSNIVIVRVRKIPTKFIIDSKFEGLIGKPLTVRGILVDYYKKPLFNATVYLNSTEVLTNKRGEFFKQYTFNRPKVEKILVSFPGDDIHEGTRKVIEIAFLKYPVTIVLDPEKNKIYLGDKVKITGIITGLEYATPIEIYMNKNPYRIVNASKRFEITFTPSSLGTYTFYAFYPGDELHQEATSNIVSILVVKPPEKTKSNVIIVLLTIALLGALLYWRREKLPFRMKEHEEAKEDTTEEEVIEITSGEKPELPKDIREAYKLLFNEIVSKFNLKTSMTPREVLRALKESEFYNDLKVITELHEKEVYGEMELSRVEREIFFEKLERILEAVKHA